MAELNHNPYSMEHVFPLRMVFTWFILQLAIFGCKPVNSEKKDEAGQEAPSIFELQPAAEAGLDQTMLLEMQHAIADGEYPNIHSVLLARRGRLVVEAYFPGADEIWGDDLGVVNHGAETLHDVRSISKTIVSLCVGMAVKNGEIESVDQRLLEYFPEYEAQFSGAKSELTIAHLLTMTSGLEWNEDVPYDDPHNSEIQMTNSADPIGFILSRPLATRPGEAWRYNGGTTQLLATIVEKVSGLPIDRYAEKHLFHPLGIEQYSWTKFPGMDLPAAASGLRLTSRDLMKFGWLIARDGRWGEDQLLPSAWMRDAMRSHITFGRNNNVGYGYQFWILSASTIYEGEDHSIVAAFGNGDQRIYVDQKRDLIVVFTAGNYNRRDIRKDSEAVLSDFVYPALTD